MRRYMYYITVYIILLYVFYIGGDLKFTFKKYKNK